MKKWKINVVWFDSNFAQLYKMQFYAPRQNYSNFYYWKFFNKHPKPQWWPLGCALFYKYFLSPNEMKLAPDVNSSYLHCIRSKNQEKTNEKALFWIFFCFSYETTYLGGERSWTQDFAPDSILLHPKLHSESIIWPVRIKPTPLKSAKSVFLIIKKSCTRCNFTLKNTFCSFYGGWFYSNGSYYAFRMKFLMQ